MVFILISPLKYIKNPMQYARGPYIALLSKLSYECNISFVCFVTAISCGYDDLVEVYTHILWYAVERAIPTMILIVGREQFLAPTVVYPEIKHP